MNKIALILLFSLLAATACAQESDTARVSDTTRQVDSTAPGPLSEPGPTDSVDNALGTIDDSIRYVFPKVDPDTLNENQRMLVEFETRLHFKRINNAATIREVESFSYADSMAHYFVTPRWDLRGEIDRAFFHDASDYFRFNPAFLRLSPQVTPLRSAVQPYGLSGNRLGLLVGGRSLTPFEHILEPDGSYDLNDIPTALDSSVAILPGPVGMLFGAQHSVAALYTRPSRYEDKVPHTSMIVDKGAFGYAYTRGRYSKNFYDGKHVDASIGYRISDGSNASLDDDAYHYTGNVQYPLNSTWVLHAQGQLYDRAGHYAWRPNVEGRINERSRIDRSSEVSMQRFNKEAATSYQFGYRYLRQGSSINGLYDDNLNNFGQGLFAAREWFSGRTAFRASVEGMWNKFDDWYGFHERYTGAGSLEIARLTRPWRAAVRLKQEYVEGYRFLPMAVGMVARESDGWYLMFSAGYSERAPSLYELHLRRTEANVYGSGRDYADQGNGGLISEKQVVGSFEVQLGSVDNNISTNVTGGHIMDGIDWVNYQEDGLTVFTPRNGDVDFATGTVTSKISLWDFFHLVGGGSYHWYDYANFNNKPYSPEYQAFAGGELHVYWESKLIHLYAYGELAYVGRYDGYVEKDLGNQPVVNARLSFALRKFRFHWVSQNVFLQELFTRDHFTEASRFTYWGFTWNFFD